MKRYTRNLFIFMDQAEDGEWVKYSEADKLLTEYQREIQSFIDLYNKMLYSSFYKDVAIAALSMIGLPSLIYLILHV